MKRFALALLALGLLSSPASAQYWYPINPYQQRTYIVRVQPVSPYSYYTPWDFGFPEYCRVPSLYRGATVTYNPNYVEPAYGGGPQEIINPYVN